MQKRATFLGLTVGVLAAAPFTTSANELLRDPETNQLYRREARVVEVPVVETQVQQQQRTVYTPEVVTEVRRHARTVYRPEVEMVYEQRVHGWWNPFKQPTVAYHLVPKTKWVAQTEQYEVPHTTTRWAPRTETVDVERRVTRMEKRVDYQLQAVNAPQRVQTPDSIASSPATRVASASGSSTREDRSPHQTGIKAQELVPVVPSAAFYR